MDLQISIPRLSEALAIHYKYLIFPPPPEVPNYP